MKNFTLTLFASQPPCVAKEKNTKFSLEPTTICLDTAKDFFRYDHSPIKFKEGYRRSKNFEYALAIVGDCDNSESDAPKDWVTIDDVLSVLKEMGINHWIVNSRNHLLLKRIKKGPVKKETMVKEELDGKMTDVAIVDFVDEIIEKAPRPKFHVYFRLSTPLFDAEKYTLFCNWFIRNFHGDPRVKAAAQQIFGYGDHPNPTITAWDDGRCIDEVLTADDLAAPKKSASSSTKPTVAAKPKVAWSPQPQQEDNDFARFTKSGEWKNHLCDLKEEGWDFFEKDGVIYFQTPEGDHSPGKHDGNINEDGVAYFFSKAPLPFEENKGYSLCQFFAGILFGDIDKPGLRKFAMRYFMPSQVSLSEPIVRNSALISLLDWIKPMNFLGIAYDKDVEKISQHMYHVLTVSRLLAIAEENGFGLAANNGFATFIMESSGIQSTLTK